MKCKDFEFEFVVAPNEISGDACEHLKTCAACQAFVEKQKVFDGQLASVINADVPVSLRDSLRKKQGAQAGRWRYPVMSMALAASLIMGVGLVSLVSLNNEPSALPIDRLIVEHFDHDGERSYRGKTEVNPMTLVKLGETFGVKVKLADTVSFVEKCPIGDSYGLHLVYQHNNQPVTLIYMPEIPLDEAVSFYYAGLKGWVKPVQKGSLAVLAGSTAELPKQEQANDIIEWL